MDERTRVLAINPGSTSTKIALFDDYDELFSVSIYHSNEALKAFNDIQDQLGYRAETVERAVAEKGYAMDSIDVFAGRGGGLVSVAGGVYDVSELMVEHAASDMVSEHPAQLGLQIAKKFADKFGKRAVIVNPPDVDEFYDEARVTGVKGIYRESHIHTLNQKEIAMRFCASRGLDYKGVNLIVCHLGGGISITAHAKGRMIDSNDIIMGSGPMTPTRAGDLPYIEVIGLAYSGAYTKKELTDMLNKEGGLANHFGTAEMNDVLKMIDSGDKYARTVFRGMVYQIAKYIGAMAAALKGDVKAIILTGGISNNELIAGLIAEYVSWIAGVAVMPGEFELEALAAGAIRVVRGEEEVKAYTGVPVWKGIDE